MTTLLELVRRFESVPEALRATLQTEVNLPLPGLLEREEVGFDVTGVGASELGARLMVQVLSSTGVRARFVPISTFSRSFEVPLATCLIVFSQGLSPNARLSLGAAAKYERTFLFTGEGANIEGEFSSVAEIQHGILRHPPASESGALLRLVGPPCAALLGLMWAARVIEARQGRVPRWFEILSDLPQRYANAAVVEASMEEDPVACVVPGALVALAPTLMWKWQEAVYAPLAPTFDLLAFAHGPLQSIIQNPALVLTLEQEGDELLLASLRKVLDPSKHRIFSLRGSLPAPLSIFEYDAALSCLALREMQRRQINPEDWPGKAAEKALYEIGLPSS